MLQYSTNYCLCRKNQNRNIPISGHQFITQVYAFIFSCDFYFTDENLFPDLYNLRFEPVSDLELPNYMPPLEESCKVKFKGDWETYKRFEAKRTSGN